MSSAVPVWTVRPSRMTAMRSPRRMVSLRSCVMNTMVFLRVFCSWSSWSCMSRRISGSSALNDSSMSSGSASAARARARPTRCCIPPDSSSGQDFSQPASRRGRAPRCTFLAFGARYTLDLQAVRGVLQDAAVQEEREVLEDHADAVRADRAQFAVAQRGQGPAVEADVARGGLQEPVEHAQQGGLAGAGQAHDDGDLARLHGEGGVDHGGGGAVSAQFGAVGAGAEAFHRFVGSSAKTLHRFSAWSLVG